MSFLADLGAAGARLGGKARSLAQLAEHGLATPPGFAVTDALFRAVCPGVPHFARLDQAALASLDRLREGLMQAPWPAGFLDELHARLRAIGAPSFAVRSSFASEDLPGQLAPGVYESCGNVPMSKVEGAIRQVLCSALAPGAVAYAMAHGQRPAMDPVSVLVHAFVTGQAEGSAAFAPERMAEPLVTLRRGHLPARAEAALGRTLATLAAARGPIEIEWVFSEGRVVYLQARPFEAPPAPVSWPGFDELGGETARDKWHWDVAHNPLPLSPAQAGLVELVDARCSVGIRQRVLGGYLFYARDQAALPTPIAAVAASDFFAALRAEVEAGIARIARLGAQPDLEEALALFVFAYEPIFGVLQPALRQAHESLRAFLETHAPVALVLLPALRFGVASMASERRERAARIFSAGNQEEGVHAGNLAHYLDLFGDEAPIWDVCAATYAEEPTSFLPEGARFPYRSRGEPAGIAGREPSREGMETLPGFPYRSRGEPAGFDGGEPSWEGMETLPGFPCQQSTESTPPYWQGASAQVEAKLPAHLHEQWRHLLDVARAAVALGEADDWLYARTQAAVRRGLLAVGRRLSDAARLRAAADVFYLPLDLVRGLALGSQARADFAALAAEGQAAWQRALGLPPPLPDAACAQAVCGVGTGGRAIGRVAWHRPGLLVPADRVLLAKALLPTELPLISAIAIVTETGGPLDHVAAQARERGIPAVVGARGARAVFVDGDLVLVDGDAGLVVKLV